MSAPEKSTKSLTTTAAAADSNKHLLKSSYLEEYNNVRANAMPLSRAANWDTFLSYFKCADPNYHQPSPKEMAKVSLWTLLSYSTRTERVLMILGVIMATFTGLGIPAWLIYTTSTIIRYLFIIGSTYESDW